MKRIPAPKGHLLVPCDFEELRHVPLFELLDDDELRVLAAHVDIRRFAPRQRIFKIGDPANHAYIIMEGRVRLITEDEDHQEVVVDESAHGEFFGLASMLQQSGRHTTAMALEDEVVCVEIDRDDLIELISRRPSAAMDMLTVQARQFQTVQKLVQSRSYTTTNVILAKRAWDPYPFILLNLFLSMLAAVQAPVIMMSQNRQDKKDRLRSELDFEVNRRSESGIQSLSHRLSLVMDKMCDMEEILRNQQVR
jgi:CRP-like cAMP-binding protein